MFFRKRVIETKCICDRYAKFKDVDSHLFNLEVEIFNLQKTIDGLDQRINNEIRREPSFNKKIIFILIGSLTASLGAIYELFQIFFR